MNTITNLRSYYRLTPDPRGVHSDAVDRAFRPNAAGATQASLLASITNANQPHVFLTLDSTMPAPMPVALGYSIDNIGDPNNTGHTYMAVGDRSDTGVMPSVVAVNDTIFEVVQNVTIPTPATAAVAWQALAAAPDNFLPIPGHATQVVDVRRAVPVPHHKTEELLQQHATDSITSRWLVEDHLADLLADPILLAAHEGCIFGVLAFTTLSQNAPPLPPTAQMIYQAVFGTRRVNDMLPLIFGRYCPGAIAPTTLQANVQSIATQQNQIAQSQATIATNLTNQSRQKTLKDTSPVVHDMVLKVSQKISFATVTNYWQLAHTVNKTGTLAAGQQAASEGPGVSVLINLPFATDLIGGLWVPTTSGALDQGLALTRCATHALGPAVVAAHARNMRATTIMEVYNPQGAELVQMVLAPEASFLSQNTMQLHTKLVGMEKLLRSLWLGSDVHTNYRDGVSNHATEITEAITHAHFTKMAEMTAKVELFVQHELFRQMQELLDGPVPTAAAPTPVTPTSRYGRIMECLQSNTMSTLIDLPEGLFANPRVMAPPVGNLQRAVGDPPNNQDRNLGGRNGRDQGGARNGGGPNDADRRHPVYTDPAWNQPLRAAWTASGNRGLFSVGAPFHRPNNPPNNRQDVYRDPPSNNERICLSMACKGECMDNCGKYHGPLTDGEQRRVADEGGLRL